MKENINKLGKVGIVIFIIIFQIITFIVIVNDEPKQIIIQIEDTSLLLDIMSSSPNRIATLLYNSPKLKSEFFNFLYPYEVMYQDPYFKWTCSTYSIAFDTLMKIKGLNSRKVNLISNNGDPHVVVELCENNHWVVYDVVNRVKWDYSAWELNNNRSLINLEKDYRGADYKAYFDEVYTIGSMNEGYSKEC